MVWPVTITRVPVFGDTSILRGSAPGAAATSRVGNAGVVSVTYCQGRFGPSIEIFTGARVSLAVGVMTRGIEGRT